MSLLIKHVVKCPLRVLLRGFSSGVRCEFKILISKNGPRRMLFGVEGMVVFYSVRILFRSLDPGVLPLP